MSNCWRAVQLRRWKQTCSPCCGGCAATSQRCCSYMNSNWIGAARICCYYTASCSRRSRAGVAAGVSGGVCTAVECGKSLDKNNVDIMSIFTLSIDCLTLYNLCNC